jgi:hypothetical protein
MRNPVLPPIWKKPDDGGEYDQKTHPGEGKSYPVREHTQSSSQTQPITTQTNHRRLCISENIQSIGLFKVSKPTAGSAFTLECNHVLTASLLI